MKTFSELGKQEVIIEEIMVELNLPRKVINKIKNELIKVNKIARDNGLDTNTLTALIQRLLPLIPIVT